jgi:hypothetical protein
MTISPPGLLIGGTGPSVGMSRQPDGRRPPWPPLPRCRVRRYSANQSFRPEVPYHEGGSRRSVRVLRRRLAVLPPVPRRQDIHRRCGRSEARW